MKKLLAIVLAAMLLVALVGCAAEPAATETEATEAPATEEATATEETAAVETTEAAADFKVGFIFLHDENSTYDKNFMDAAKAACAACGIPEENIMMKTNIAESNDCYEAAAEMVDAGCKVIFADSFGHEDYMIQAAKEFTDVQFFHATGTQSQQVNLDNFHNAFADIYMGRFLAGVAAGMKINEMIDSGKITADQAKMGYVGAYPYEEVKSGYTSFYLGAKYVCPSVTMEVKCTNSWFDIALEKEAAIALINDGCVLISQHADSEGAPKACEENGIPNVAYNISTISIAPNTALISSKIDWTPYMTMMIQNTMAGEAVPTDYCATMQEGAVVLTELNTAVAAEGTAEKLEEVKAMLESGELKVFDTSTFTVNGEVVTSYLANFIPDEAYAGDTEVVSDGYVHESEYRSAPCFGLDIDGITSID